LDSMRMGSPGKPLQSFSRAAILNGLKEKMPQVLDLEQCGSTVAPLKRITVLLKLSDEQLVVSVIKHIDAPVQCIPFNHDIIEVNRLMLWMCEAIIEVCMDNLTHGPGRNIF
jgi:hypothetical protein